jgi:FlaA1/EpsC-like NDP-sugar epimerase/lipopolysaccharide/colanic/teichoic acid biosynthesis glycosyltransferase
MTTNRIFDILFSLIGLIILSPLLAVIGLAVKLHDGGTALYKARRVGKNGTIFYLLKFRTMVPDAHKLGPAITGKEDDRITRLGRFLRRSKLDELPQLINVLKGEMAFVGPRPEDPKYVAKYTPEQRTVLTYVPGITSPVSLHLRNEEALFTGGDWLEEYEERVLPHKIETELNYLRRRTLASDFRIVIMTVLAILFLNKRTYKFLLSFRNRHLLAFDVLFALILPSLALSLRLDGFGSFQLYMVSLAVYTITALAWKLAIFFPANLYNRYWRYASVHELAVLAVATMASATVGMAVFFWFLMPWGLVGPGFPRSIPIIDGALTMIQVGAVRFAFRFVFDMNERLKTTTLKRRVVVAGAGAAGSMIVKEMRSNPHLGMDPVGFVDDDPYKNGMLIHGVPVMGRLKDLPDLLKSYRIEHVVVAMPRAPGKVLREVVLTCKSAGVKSRTVPGVFEILEGSAKMSDIRDVDIEDLLRRGVVSPQTEDVAAFIKGARVMVTGAGGSIGAEICRQIILHRPSELVLVGHGENSIFHIAAELTRSHSHEEAPVQIHTVVADIRSRDRMDLIFQIHRPEIIFHAAAHKHVGLMEVNVPDAVTNNVLGTQVMVDLAAGHAVQRFVMISTDKAVKPTSIMGVTKRIAELVVQDAARRTGRAFVSVRFGNVLGSRGSVIPLFKRQIAEGGPLLVSHPEATRYFMTIPESVQLVLQAATMGRGGEVFVLDMGEPVRILDLARDLLRLSGREEGRDIDIVFTGLKRGEKMNEELFYEWEKPVQSGHDRILVHRNDVMDELKSDGAWSVQDRTVRYQAERLVVAAEVGELKEVERIMQAIVPEYRPGNGSEDIPKAKLQTPKRKEEPHLPAHTAPEGQAGISKINTDLQRKGI